MRYIVTLITIVAGLSLAGSARASPWNRNCGKYGSGPIEGTNLQWEYTTPMHIGMTYATALHIQRQLPLQEFNTVFRVSDVPCAVALDIAYDASWAWANRWPGNDGWTGVGWDIGYSPGPYMGRVFCTAYVQDSTDLQETCHHNGNRNAGAYTGSFWIEQNPYWPYNSTRKKGTLT